MVGMTEEELLKLCRPNWLHRGIAPWIFWTVERYSHGKYIREYAYYPKILPLIAYGDHSSGVKGTDIPSKHELESDAPLFLTFSVEKARLFTEMTGKKSYCILSPAVFYRRQNSIKALPTAKGTIAFPAHSTPDIDTIGNIENYICALKELPPKYQPVTACLYMHDILKGQHKEFIKHGIPVVTAGDVSDYRFIDRFYSIIKNFEYTTSNTVGAYTSLSIEMGIPFFVYGAPQLYFNHSDKNVKSGVCDLYDNQPFYQYLHKELTFEAFDVSIDPVVKAKIEEKLGINHTISRRKLSSVLYRSFFLWLINPKSFLLLAKRLFSKITKK